MAIFGCFSDIPMPDIMNLIGHSAGTLTISRNNNQLVYLFSIENMTIRRVLFNGQDVVNHEQAISFIAELVQANEGDFEFQKGEVARGPHELSINQVLFSSLAMIDEIKAYQDHFPDPATYFVATESGQRSNDPDLMIFFEEISPQLQEGTNAHQIRDTLGLYLDQVLLRLYKLRALGMITPKRVFEQAEPEAILEKIRVATQPIANLVKDRPKAAEPTAPARPSRAGRPNRPAPKPQDVQIYQPPQTVMRHLMSSIWSMVSTRK